MGGVAKTGLLHVGGELLQGLGARRRHRPAVLP